MKKILLIFSLLITALAIAPVALAQKKLTVEKPDLEHIRRATLDPASKFYYPRLQALYDANDTTMTPEQYRYYYFGTMYQEDYNPYRKSDYTDRTDSLLSLNQVSRLRRDSTIAADKAKKVGQFELTRRYQEAKTRNLREQKEIVKIAEKALADNPFDLQSMYMLSRLLKDMGKNMSARIWDYRLENILGAIVSSGTGKDEQNAFFVISPDHEYFLLEVLGYDVDDYEYREPGFDYLKVTPSDPARANRSKTPPAFFFDVRPLIQQYNIKYPENSAESSADGEEINLEN